MKKQINNFMKETRRARHTFVMPPPHQSKIAKCGGTLQASESHFFRKSPEGDPVSLQNAFAKLKLPKEWVGNHLVN